MHLENASYQDLESCDYALFLAFIQRCTPYVRCNEGGHFQESFAVPLEGGDERIDSRDEGPLVSENSTEAADLFEGLAQNVEQSSAPQVRINWPGISYAVFCLQKKKRDQATNSVD